MSVRPIALVISYHAVILLAVLASSSAHAQFTVVPRDPPYELWKIDANGGETKRFAETPGYTCGSPDWSPDGRLIAYDTWRIGQTFQDSMIVVIRADGSGQKIIGEGGMPSWSPDGKQLTCHTYDSPQTIIVMNADGSGRETIINHWGSPRWLPRGNRIASLNTNGKLSLFDLSDGKERAFISQRRAASVSWGNNSWTTAFAAEIGFGVSPDGRQLCFGDRDGGLFFATLDDRDQAAVRQVSESLLIRHCSFSPDGKRIVFGGSSTPQEAIDIEAERVKGTLYPHEQLFVFDFRGKDSIQRISGQDGQRVNSCPDWSPDGKTIIFVSQDPKAKPTEQK